MFLTIISAIFVIGILILVHELGHFLAAKWMKVRVEVFSLGFGPKLLGIRGKETEYKISVIPLGGYVKLYGEHPESISGIVETDRAFAFKAPWQKALIVLAGPLANFLFAFLIFWMLFITVGVYYIPSKIGEVLPNSPAEKVGLQKGDEILEINGKRIISFEELLLNLREKEIKGAVKLKIKRGEEIWEVLVTPEFKEGYNIFGQKTTVPFLGIKAVSQFEFKRYNPLEAFFLSFKKIFQITALTFKAIFKLFTGELPFSTLGGPLTIGKMAGDTARLGLVALISFAALLSINLGIINIIPLPMLDGGYLVIFGIEALRGQPISLRTQEIIFKIGLILIIALSIAVFYNDILRLLSGWKTP